MATIRDKTYAQQLVRDKLTGSGKGYYWPKLQIEEVRDGLIDRVTNPDIIYQSAANVCGMASFVHELITVDPIQYTWFAIGLFHDCAGRLGRDKDSVVISPSVQTRSSPLPSGMSHADWVVLASLRDYSNKVLKYSYNAKVPILSDIPILGLLGQSFVAEPVGGISWPKDIENLLRAAGFKSIVNAANIAYSAGYKNMERASDFFSAGYQVLMLISNAMLSGKGAPIAEHWVTLESTIEENGFAYKSASGPSGSGVTFTVFNPARKKRHRVPLMPQQYIPLKQFTDNFYGFVAGKA